MSKMLDFNPAAHRGRYSSVSSLATLPVISVGNDPTLLGLREQIIRGANVAIRSMPPEEAEAEARLKDARLWIFCSTIALPQLVYLACSVHRYSPSSRLVLLEGVRPAGFEAALFHRIIHPEESIDEMLRAVTELSAVA
jgi:hypothetical protein